MQGATGNAQLSGAICGIFTASRVLRSRFPSMENDNRRLNIRHHGVDARFIEVSRANSQPDWNILIAKQTSTVSQLGLLSWMENIQMIGEYSLTRDYDNNCNDDNFFFFTYVISRMKLNLAFSLLYICDYLCIWYKCIEKIV